MRYRADANRFDNVYNKGDPKIKYVDNGSVLLGSAYTLNVVVMNFPKFWVGLGEGKKNQKT